MAESLTVPLRPDEGVLYVTTSKRKKLDTLIRSLFVEYCSDFSQVISSVFHVHLLRQLSQTENATYVLYFLCQNKTRP